VISSFQDGVQRKPSKLQGALETARRTFIEAGASGEKQ
jgi:hypothetical protein